MYGWLWRHIPGPTPMRVLVVLATVVALFFLLMEVVYPDEAELAARAVEARAKRET